jgi:hypothetical protein
VIANAKIVASFRALLIIVLSLLRQSLPPLFNSVYTLRAVDHGVEDGMDSLGMQT